MSYSNLILTDSPECVWALEEASGTVVTPFSYILDEAYEGSYNSGKYLVSKVPIVYSGKTSITNNGDFTGSANYSSNNVMFSIPSIGKFSSATRGKSYTLEFWMNLDFDPTSLSAGSSSRIGESKIVGVTGATTSGLYIRDLDYLVFKVGDTGYRMSESSFQVNSFNNPLHIMIVYTPYSIQLFVNGSPGTLGNINENIYGDEEERSIQFLFPNRISSSSSYFNNISYDSVAMYPQQLNDIVAKRHYIYGLGYDVPGYTIKSIGGVQYQANLQITTPLRQINYLNNNTWSSRTILNNLQYTDDNLSTVSYNNQKLYLSSSDVSKNEKNMISSSGIIFPENCYSYLEIDNYELITDGDTKKIEAKFTLTGSHASTGEQQLLFVGSKSIEGKYISFTIINRTIYVKYKTVNGTETSLFNYTLSSGSNTFFVSFAKDSGNIAIRIVDSLSSGSGTIQDATIFPMQEAYLRFGSAPVFFGESVPLNYGLNSVSRFDGVLEQVDISNSNTPTSVWSSYPAKKNSSLYQVYSNPETKSLCVATSGTFLLTLSLIDLIGLEYFNTTVSGIKLAPKVEIGSAAAEITYKLKSIVGETTTIHENNENIRSLKFPNGITSTIKAEELQYEISGTLRSSDVLTSPGILDYFRIYTYPVLVESSRNYIEINDENPGPNPKYFSGYSSSTNHPFVNLPEIEKTSDLHRSFRTGILVGTHGSRTPYLKIPCDSLTITTEATPKIYAVFFNARKIEGLSSAMELLRTSSHTVNWTTPEPSGVQMYVNGTRWSSGGTYNQSLWNNYCIKFTSGIPYNSDIFFGFSGSGWTIDNISVILDNISATKISELYSKMFGFQVSRYPDNQASNVFNVVIGDKEFSDGQFTYQPLSNQVGILSRSLCPIVASVRNLAISLLSGTTYRVTYNKNRDLIKIDGREIQLNDRILLKNQSTASLNGIYLVTAKTDYVVDLVKQTNPPENTPIFVTSGNENKNYYFNRVGNVYTKTLTQKKVVFYDKAGFTHQAKA
jgi:hypothetical protein